MTVKEAAKRLFTAVATVVAAADRQYEAQCNCGRSCCGTDPYYPRRSEDARMRYLMNPRSQQAPPSDWYR